MSAAAEDLTMDDTVRRLGQSDDDPIRKKILDLLPTNRAFLQRSTFTLLKMDTVQLQSLRAATPHTMEISADDTDYLGVEINKLERYDITVDGNVFLNLICTPKKFYAREGYQELYEYICDYWKSRNRYHVVLLGNAGTGKSWFQVYALKQLMSCDKDKRDYDIVIRQVASDFYLIDLDEALVYLWRIDSGTLKELSKALGRTLYFFEPDNDATRSPLYIALPSLSTLSPYVPRLKQYGKDSCEFLYFWPWSSGELRAVIDSEDSNPPIMDDATFSDRYHKFGGVVRHVLGQDDEAEGKLQDRLKEISIDILTTTILSIDREATDYKVSSLLICYDNRLMEGKGRFAEINLEYTSASIVEEVQSIIRMRSVKEIMLNVLNRLSGTKIDISAKNLERATMELISQGSKLGWERREIGANQAGWEVFVVSDERTIAVEFCLTDQFRQPGLIIAPKNTTFPVIDFVFSMPSKSEFQEASPVVAFLCTWRKRLSIHLKALCSLRRKHMKIPDDQILEIYMVCPKHEEQYTSRTKEEFIVGELNRDIPLDTETTVYIIELQTLWATTKLFVVRPKIDESSSWEEQIEAYLSLHP